MREFRVVIPYFYEFYVMADNPGEAVSMAHVEGDGSILCWDDSQAEVEEVV